MNKIELARYIFIVGN